MKKILSAIAIVAMTASVAIAAESSPDIPSEVTLFKNVKVFDGTSDDLKEGLDVLVVQNMIHKVAKDIPTSGSWEVDVKTGGVKQEQGAKLGVLGIYSFNYSTDIKTEKKEVTVNVIDGQGMTLMPGLIDTHAHPSIPLQLNTLMYDVDWMQWGVTAAAVTTEYLFRGWTTVRDTGGPAMGLQRSIDAGHLIGPRIYPSGATISQTSGHGDHRGYNIQNPNFPNQNPIGILQSPTGLEVLCDGVPEVLRCVREVLRTGATQIKLHAGGGASSVYDPLYTVQYSPSELEAAVKTARDYGTYVMVHAYNDDSIIRSLDAGVRSIEHGQLMTEKSMEKLIEKDAWISPYYTFMDTPMEDLVAYVGEANAGKLKEIYEGAENQIRLLIENKYHKVALGADVIGPPENHRKNNLELKIRARYWSNAEVLHQATSINAELLKESGKRDPYPNALGVINEGAYADILLVDGNPLEDIELLSDNYEESLKIIMKDGVIYKNTLN